MNSKKTKFTFITASIFFLLIVVRYAWSDWNTDVYNEGYELGYNKIISNREKGIYENDPSGAGFCGGYISQGGVDFPSGSELWDIYKKGCMDGYQAALSGGKPNPQVSTNSGPSDAQLMEEQNLAYKHCETNYFSRNIYETDCCVKKILDERIKRGPTVSLNQMIFETDFRGCVSRPKVIEYGSNRSYELIEVEIGYKYTKEQAEQISSCTGNALAEKYMPNPITKMGYINNIFREQWRACMQNSSYTVTGGSVNQPYSSSNQVPGSPSQSPPESNQEPSTPSEPAPSINDSLKQTNETMKEIKSTIDEFKNLKNIFE